MLRAKVEIEEKSNGKQSIIVTELPYRKGTIIGYREVVRTAS